MKITRIYIENFGILHDLTLETQENLTTIHQQNGWGKSTLADFIGAMLYGMPKKGNNKAYAVVRSKRKSWQGGIYGGSLDFVCSEGEFRVIRTFADTPEGDTFQLIDLKTGTVSDKFSKNLGEELFGVGKETFDITAFFPQMNLLFNINDETRANLTGANKFEYDLQNLEGAKKKITEKMRLLKKEIATKTELESLSYEKEKLRADMKTLANERESLEKQNHLDPSLIKIEIDRELEKRAEIEAYKKKKAALEGEIISLQNGLSTAPVKQNNKWLILGFSLGMMALLGVIVALGVTKIFELTGAIAIGLVLILAYIVGIIFITKRTGRVAIDNEKQKQLYLKQQEYQNYLQDKEYDESRLQSLQRDYFTLDKEISLRSERLKNIDREQESLATRLEALEDEFDRKTELTQSAQKGIKLLEKTLELMRLAQNNVSQRYIEPMQNSFDKYFKTLTDKNIALNVNFEAVERTNLGDKEFEYLSQGYKDIVLICKRLALLDKIYEKEKPVIILDDPFVNLDEKRLEIMRKLIREEANRYQIIYLYCNENNEI